MTPAEFKAWFGGFTEAFTGCPTKAQWARIKDRVAEIDGRPTTERIYLDRYWPGYWHSYHSPTILCGSSGVGVVTTSDTVTLTNASFDSITAMTALGRAEARL